LLADLDFGAVGTELGKRWKALTDKEKEPFAALNNTDKARYAKEMTKYVPSEEYAKVVKEKVVKEKKTKKE
jgi:phage I-like protein